MNKLLIALLLLPLMAVAQPRIVVVGDSLSSTYTSWPQQLEQAMGMDININRLTQPGRTARSYAIPRDLVGEVWGIRSTAIYFLGTNDGFQNMYQPHVRRHINRHITMLVASGFNVVVVNIPVFHYAYYDLTVNKNYRSMIWREYRDNWETDERVTYLDSNTVWKPEDTVDGIHPNDELSYQLAGLIARHLVYSDILEQTP